jgi:hypothetical protein
LKKRRRKGGGLHDLLGACNRAYHTHCISKWTTQKKNTCPLCQKAWTTVKTAKEG